MIPTGLIPGSTWVNQINQIKISNEMETGNEEISYYHDKISKFDDLNAKLDEMKDQIIKTNVRCHMLHVDLVTQFNPHTQEIASRLEQTCEKCKAKLDAARATNGQ